MKFAYFFIAVIVLASCGMKVPYTNNIRDEYGLNTEKDIKNVQFFTSSTLILEKSKSSGNQGTNESGVLVSNSSKEQDRVIIPVNTKCVFDGYGPDSTLMIRFETGVGKSLSFASRPGQNNGKYYLVAVWKNNQGELKYGSETYTVNSTGGNTHLLVVLKKLQTLKRKDRIVRGMKV